jgi:hypothetical protein
LLAIYELLYGVGDIADVVVGVGDGEYEERLGSLSGGREGLSARSRLGETSWCSLSGDVGILYCEPPYIEVGRLCSVDADALGVNKDLDGLDEIFDDIGDSETLFKACRAAA